MKNNPTAAAPQATARTAATFFPAAGASFFGPAPQTADIQRTPEETGDMHAGIAEDYRRRHGLTEDDGIPDARIVYQLSDPAYVLNHEPYSARTYTATIQAWPDSRAIWPVLSSPSAKINFVRFILSFDQTNCRPNSVTGGSSGGSCEATSTALQTFENACQGYATQMYTRYTSATRMDAATTGRLSSMARIDVGSVPVKFHIPIFIATVPGHAFNAVQVADNAADIRSYIFFEPQNDQVFTADSATLRTGIYASAGTFTLSRLTGFNETGQYQQEQTHTFIMDSTGTFSGYTLRMEQRVAIDRVMRDIFIVDDRDTWNLLQQQRPGITYETVIRETTTGMPDDTLAMVFRFLNGRRFRRTAAGALETMDRTIYLQLMNRPSLERLIP